LRTEYVKEQEEKKFQILYFCFGFCILYFVFWMFFVLFYIFGFKK